MGKLKTVLLVDDDDTTNFLNKFFLNQLDKNLEVNTALNGKAAIDFLLSHGKDLLPCLIVLDTNMPIMDGWEFLNSYGQNIADEIKKKTVVVMMTAVDTDAVVTRALSNPNVNDTAQKPLSDVKFKNLIKKHFS